MTIPIIGLLVFAGWTLLTLGTTHGFYRWGAILRRKARFDDFAEYRIEGDKGWYVRGMRAHANCVENLPVYGALVVVASAAGIDDALFDILSVLVVAVRVPHTAVHVLFEQTNTVVAFRSLLFITQFVAMVAMAAVLALHAVN